MFDQAGNLYGTTRNGGAYLQGTVYELTPEGVGWTEKVLYSFAGPPDGSAPLSGPVFRPSRELVWHHLCRGSEWLWNGLPSEALRFGLDRKCSAQFSE